MPSVCSRQFYRAVSSVVKLPPRLVAEIYKAYVHAMAETLEQNRGDTVNFADLFLLTFQDRPTPSEPVDYSAIRSEMDL